MKRQKDNEQTPETAAPAAVEAAPVESLAPAATPQEAAPTPEPAAAPAEAPPAESAELPPAAAPERRTLAEWAELRGWAHWELAGAAINRPVNELHTEAEAEGHRQRVRNIPIGRGE